MHYESLQEIFDLVARHLLIQNAKSIILGNYCRYRDFDGRSCAIGCLIPDDMYEEGMEGTGVTGLVETYPEINDMFPSEAFNLMDESEDDINDNSSFMSRLQIIHDEYEPQHWHNQLAEVALDFGLSQEVLK